MTKPATVDKSVGKSEQAMQPGRNGGLLRKGSLPGNTPGTGRPPDAWKARMEALADRWAQAVETKKVVDNPKHPHFMNAGKFAVEQAHGQAAKRLELTGPGAVIEVIVRNESKQERAG